MLIISIILIIFAFFFLLSEFDPEEIISHCIAKIIISAVIIWIASFLYLNSNFAINYHCHKYLEGYYTKVETIQIIGTDTITTIKYK